uniref:Uncharacterized protein n=1 Tax=Ananas comosus var. bracteatus TaxID=296719 RepID=A0A6V7PCD0_ANACO|nr:unnamed protein product [Ananas comosus var. bracteatus]
MHREGRSFRNVEGAKEQVQSMVKSDLKRLTKDSPLERDNFKRIARRATHIILAAFGIKHHSRMVTGPLQPPPNCSHDFDGKEPAFVSNNCCSSCFGSFIKDMLQKTIRESSDH